MDYKVHQNTTVNIDIGIGNECEEMINIMYLNTSPSLQQIKLFSVSLSNPTPQNPPLLMVVVKRLGSIVFPIIISEANTHIQNRVIGRPLVTNRVISSDGIIIILVIIQAGFHHVLDPGPIGGGVQAVRLRDRNRVKVDALPHTRTRDMVQVAIQQLILDEVGGLVDDGNASLVNLGANGDAPLVAAGAEPGGGGVPKVGRANAGRWEQDGVAGALHPLEEKGIGQVGRVGETLDLHGVVGVAGVEHDDLTVGEDGGGAGPDTVDVVPLVGDHGVGEVEPVD